MNRGFTLFEVLVALAIIAIAMTAVMRASAQASEGAYQLRQRMLANWVAQNRMAELTAFQTWPGVGVISGKDKQAGIVFSWQEEISSTPNPLFKKVVITVTSDSISNRLNGYILRPMP